MKSMHRCVTLLVVAAALQVAHCAVESTSPPPENDDEMIMWYTSPANASAIDSSEPMIADPEWMKALPLGNGVLGAMVFGDVNYERIQLNEESMWPGGYIDDASPKAFNSLEKIRELLFNGNYKEATELAGATQVPRTQGHTKSVNGTFGCYQTLGDLYLDFGRKREDGTSSDRPYSRYHRQLSLTNGAFKMRYKQAGIYYERKAFVSAPDKVFVMRLAADKEGSISFEASLKRPERYHTTIKRKQLIMYGALNAGLGNNATHTHYMARLTAVATGGKVTYIKGKDGDAKIRVENADEVVLLLSASTSYKLSYPSYQGRDFESLSADAIDNAVAKGYDELLKAHSEDHRPMFERVSFTLTPDTKSKLIPTDERVLAAKKGRKDLHLQELIFQFGRYLMMASSRPGSLPANLQGIWCNKIKSAWEGDFHLDLNIYMNYWVSEVANLSETHLPLFDFIDQLAQAGKEMARVQYHQKGWAAHTCSNAWGYTAPIIGRPWGLYVGAAAWLSSHILEHYAFTQDTDWLIDIYPLLTDTVEFYMGWLVKHPKTGKYVSGPSISPENSFIAPDGSEASHSMGASHDQEVIWQLFTDFLTASKTLKRSGKLIRAVTARLEQLAAPSIGKDGRLLEWHADYKEVEPGHRHISHLWANHPGSQYTPRNAPNISAAMKKSLDHRIASGGGQNGWFAAWPIAQYARFHDGTRAMQQIKVMMKDSIATNLFSYLRLKTDFPKGSAPFQIEANFGTTAGMAEMLLQSHAGVVEILPALPQEWSNGRIQGLRARGGIEIDIHWKNNKLVAARLTAEDDVDVMVVYKKRQEKMSLMSGATQTFRGDGAELNLRSIADNVA